MDPNVVPLAPRSRPATDDGTTDTTRRPDLAALPLLLPVPTAAKLLGISRSAAYRLAESGELPVRRLGGRVYIVTSRLLDLVEAA